MRAVVRPLSLPADRRVLVISDIHGNLPFLKGLLKKVQFSTDDILLVLGDILEKSTGGLDTLPHNGAVLTLLAVLALLLALFIRRRPRRFDGRALLLLLPLLAPVLWTLALSNHASDHTYFTYRNLCGAFFALFALPALLAPDRTPSP